MITANHSSGPALRATRAIVHVVDDDDAVREATALLLEALGYIVRRYRSGCQFLETADLRTGGCVVLDLRMPGLSGLDVQEALSRQGSRLPVMIVTGHGDVRTAVNAMKIGATDFIEKPYAQHVLVAAIDRAIRASMKGPGEDAAAGAKARIARLSPRECQVLHALMRGQANKAIALELKLSPRTVEMHRARMMERLGAGSLSEALRIAFHAGLEGPRDMRDAA